MISVIVPTYNGAKKVENLVNSLKIQDFKDFELIIVIDGSNDSTYETIKRIQVKFPLHLIVQKNSGRSASRNNGVSKAKGDLICFFDDDMVLGKDCLQKHYDYNLQIPGSITVGPTIEDPKTRLTDFQKYKCKINFETLDDLGRIKGPMAENNLFVTAANLSMRKDTFWEVGGFDERLPDAEDYEFGFRALLKNKKIYFRSDALAYHEEFITCRSFIKRQREYFKGQEILKSVAPAANKYSESLKEKDGSIKLFLYNMFSHKIIVDMIDRFNIFKIFPASIRYRFYSLVVWGLGRKFPYRNI